jgi:hypothetical protein
MAALSWTRKMSDSFATELAAILAEDSSSGKSPLPLEPGDIEVYEVTVKSNRKLLLQRRTADSAVPPPASGG